MLLFPPLTAEFAHSAINSTQYDSLETPSDDKNLLSQETDHETEVLSWLYRVAVHVHQDLKSSSGHEYVGGLNLKNAERVVPKSLYILLSLLSGKSIDSDNTENEVDTEESRHSKILSIAQDIVYLASGGRKQTPKHFGLGLAVHQATRSKELVQLLHPAGHCVSYDTVRRIDTTVAWNFNFFKTQGIPGPSPTPFYGNTLGFVLMKPFEKWKREYGKVVGFFIGREPALCISDLDILREVLVKNFNNFTNRRNSQLTSYPMNLGVFFLEDTAWKRVRSIITPTFSSDKLRGMCASINDCAVTLTNNFCRTFNKGKSVDMKKHFGGYTMDVISQTAFGVKVDSQNDFNHPFVVSAKAIFTPPSVYRRLLFLIAGIFPFMVNILKFFGVTLGHQRVMDFFTTNITAMVEERQREPKKNRADFLQLLMDAEVQEEEEGSGKRAAGDHSSKRLSMDEIIGQGMLLYIAGYETTASTLNFASYMLATHPDVQDKIYQEIIDELGDTEPTHDNIGRLRNMENVINETLRMFPPAVFINRRAAETVTIKGVTIPKGMSVFIPTYSIQRDPEIFENPDEFRPERFDEKINPVSFLSFGYGPRLCIGMRLALVEAKIALVHVLRKVKFEVADDTPIPLTFKKSAGLKPDAPNVLKLSSRH